MSDLTDWRGDALDLAIASGGVVSMRRHGRLISLSTINHPDPAGVVSLRPDEAAQVVASLVAAIALAGKPG